MEEEVPDISALKDALEKLVEKETRELEKLKLLVKLKEEEIENCQKSLAKFVKNQDN